MSRYRDFAQPVMLLVAILATTSGADAKPERKAAASTEVAQSDVEPVDGGYIIVTAPRKAKSPRPTVSVPIGATIRIDETAIRRSINPARSAKR